MIIKLYNKAVKWIKPIDQLKYFVFTLHINTVLIYFWICAIQYHNPAHQIPSNQIPVDLELYK